jgi:hypothetical protein
LTTSVERIDLARRHLIGEHQVKEENPTTVRTKVHNQHGESDLDLIANLIDTLQTEINLTAKAIKVLEKEKNTN